MKVYVVGSISADKDRVNIQNACRAIGEELAKHGHDIIVGSDHQDTVDRYVVEGANAAKKKRHTKVLVFPPEKGERRTPERSKHILFSDMKSELPNIELIYKESYGTWHSSQLAAKRADVVVAIAGAEGTDISGHYAFAPRDPTLAYCDIWWCRRRSVD